MRFHSIKLWLVALLAAGLLGGAFIAYAQDDESEKKDGDEKQVTQTQVPAAVMKTAEATIPGGKFVKASTEREEGQSLYEVVMQTADGKKVEVSTLADGTHVESEEDVTEADLPASVRQAVADVLPNGKVLEMEKKTVVVYSLKRKVGEKVYELEISADGQVQSLDQEHDED
jgi:uncharacterized membrane protein YkoI